MGFRRLICIYLTEHYYHIENMGSEIQDEFVTRAIQQNQAAPIVLNSPPSSPTWSREISSTRRQLRTIQEQSSPPRERRRSSQSPSPVVSRELSPASVSRNLNHDLTTDQNMGLDILFNIPAPVQIPDQAPMPTQYRISQLYAAYNALPPLQPVLRNWQNHAPPGPQVEDQTIIPLETAQTLPVQQPPVEQTSARSRPRRGRNRQPRSPPIDGLNSARCIISDINIIPTHNMGNMDIVCCHCNALHWLCERLSSSSARKPVFGTCCLSGKISVPLHRQPPPQLQRLYTGTSPESKYFLSHIRNFNYAFAFTSLGVQNVSIRENGPFCFKIKGRLHHRVGSFLPTDTAQYSFAQIYVLDSRDDAIEQRMRNNPNLIQTDASLTRDIMSILHDTIMEYNSLVNIYKSAFELAANQSHITLRLCQNNGLDHRRYNLPSNNEIAILLPGNETTPAQHGQQWRDIILHTHAQVGNNNQVHYQRISEIHPLYLPLQYPLLFPYGDTYFKPNALHFQNRNRQGWLF